MEALANLTRLNGKLVTLIAVLLVIGGGFAVIAGLSPDQQEELLWFVQDYLPMAMFVMRNSPSTAFTDVTGLPS